MSATATWQLYDGAADNYERYRPTYPPGIFDPLVARLGPLARAGNALDVGAGTGIFSRQLARVLPGLKEVLCVEPNEDMLRVGRAACSTVSQIRYERGFAEKLPSPDASRLLVACSTSAHWFDRPKFFSEVRRVLQPGGLLAIFQNKHRYWDDPLAADLADLLERTIPGYRRGTYSDFKGGYASVDFEVELRDAPGFREVARHTLAWDQSLTRERFHGFCYSMGHIRKVEACLGATGAREQIERLIERHTAADGRLKLGRRAELTLART